MNGLRTPPEPGNPMPPPVKPPRDCALDALADCHERRCRWLLRQLDIAAMLRKDAK